MVGEKKLAVSSFKPFDPGPLGRDAQDADSSSSLFSGRRSWVLILGMSGLIVLFWFVAGGVALRYLVLFIGVMSCLYVLWDVIGESKSVPVRWFSLNCNLRTDDTIARKVNTSDASAFADICGCCPSQGTCFKFRIHLTHEVLNTSMIAVWGVLWLVIAFVFFALGIIVGLVAFKVTHLPPLIRSSICHFLISDRDTDSTEICD